MAQISSALPDLHVRARQAATLLRLPFRSRSWRGVQGNWQGAGTGSSLDFQDHRPYTPGDDPRYINWQAYARTGHFTMKLYRQEVSPAVDVAVDLSASMFVDEEKAARTAELFYWVAECALQTGASLRCYALGAEGSELMAIETILGHAWLRELAPPRPEAARGVPWRHGSLRVFFSDLLWPGEAQAVFHALSEGQGHGMILAPYSTGEAEPNWAGNLEMLDCESSATRIQRIDASVMRRYRAAYHRHFEIWEQQAIRYHVPLARIPAGCDLAEALRAHVAGGAVEWVEGR